MTVKLRCAAQAPPLPRFAEPDQNFNFPGQQNSALFNGLAVLAPYFRPTPVSIKQGVQILSLKALEGFTGRCDAIHRRGQLQWCAAGGATGA